MLPGVRPLRTRATPPPLPVPHWNFCRGQGVLHLRGTRGARRGKGGGRGELVARRRVAVRGLVGAGGSGGGGARWRLNATQPGPVARASVLSSHGCLVRGGSPGRAQPGEQQQEGEGGVNLKRFLKPEPR